MHRSTNIVYILGALSICVWATKSAGENSKIVAGPAQDEQAAEAVRIMQQLDHLLEDSRTRLLNKLKEDILNLARANSSYEVQKDEFETFNEYYARLSSACDHQDAHLLFAEAVDRAKVDFETVAKPLIEQMCEVSHQLFSVVGKEVLAPSLSLTSPKKKLLASPLSAEYRFGVGRPRSRNARSLSRAIYSCHAMRRKNLRSIGLRVTFTGS